jgi:hypothetical protein
MNQTYLIVAIGLAVVVIGYFLMRKKTIPASAAVPTPVPSYDSTTPTVAPGVSMTTGQVPTPIPAPPRDGVAAQLGHLISPTNQMQHIPVVGNALATVSRAPINIGLKVGDTVNTALSHIPVAGKMLAAPGKAVSSALHSISSWF